MPNPSPKPANPDEYNGWANRETWLVHLWLTNEQPSDEWARHLCQAAPTEREAAYRLADELPEYLDLPTTGFMCDLVNTTLARVNWGEVAAAFREE